MNKRINRDSYVLIVIIAVAVLAVSSFVFTKYLEDQTQKTVEVSTYLSVPGTSTSQAAETHDTVAATTKPVNGISSGNEILQLISESINDENLIETNYRKFRSGQLDDISLEEYQLYIRLLKAIFGHKIESYSTMNYSERMSTIAEMRQHDPANEAFLSKASFHWLESRNDGGEVTRIPLLLSQDQENQSYLSREWVRSCLELRNYATLYFGAFLDQNVEAAQKLTYSLSPDPLIVEQKTTMLMSYYRNSVQATEIGSTEIISLRMDAITFRIPIMGAVRDQSLPVVATEATTQVPETAAKAATGGTVKSLPLPSGSEIPTTVVETVTPPATSSEDPVGTLYHDVTIYKKNGAFIAQDTVPAQNWQFARPIELNQATVLELQADYSVDELSRLFGFPTKQTKFTSTGGEGQAADYVRLVYPDLELVLSTSTDNPELHRLMAVKLTTQKYSLGEFRVGTSLQRLYQTYLYLDTLAFQYVDGAGNTVVLSVNDNQLVGQIEIQDQEYRADLLLQEQGPDEAFTLISPTPTPQPPTSSTAPGSAIPGSATDTQGVQGTTN